MSRTYVRLALILLSAALILATALSVQAAPPPAPAGPQSLSPSDKGGCNTNKIKFKTEFNSATIVPAGTSGWVAIPESVITFVVGGATTSCVKVEFSALVNSTDWVFFAATLDGVFSGLPIYTYVYAPSYQTVAFNFAIDGVSPGSHTLRMMWQAYSGATQVGPRSVFAHFWE